VSEVSEVSEVSRPTSRSKRRANILVVRGNAALGLYVGSTDFFWARTDEFSQKI